MDNIWEENPPPLQDGVEGWAVLKPGAGEEIATAMCMLGIDEIRAEQSERFTDLIGVKNRCGYNHCFVVGKLGSRWVGYKPILTDNGRVKPDED